MNAIQSQRYSQADLAEFEAVIQKKIAKVGEQLAYLEEQLAETAENMESQGDWMDDSSSGNDYEMLQTMSNRQQKHLLDLQNALQRIYNKSYGICTVTGELIDKRRLLAVPTTTKCLAAKMEGSIPAKEVFKSQPKKVNSGTPKIISRIISKPVVAPKKAEEELEELDDLYDEDLLDDGNEMENVENIDLDELVDTDSYEED